MLVNRINAQIRANKEMRYSDGGKVLETDQISDGWHTFGELYDFRLAYNALAFNLMHQYDEGVKQTILPIPLFDVHKSWKHNDGEWCFGQEKEWFIVAAKLQTGIITNHYEAKHWDKFQIPEFDKSIFEFDGHTPSDSLERIFEFLNKTK